MCEKWIRPFSNFLTLARHHIYRIVQKHAADFRRGLRHENRRAWKAPHSNRQRADVILMGMRNQDRLDPAAGDCLQMRQRILPGVLWVHATIEQQPVPASLKIVRVRANLRAASEINEFQSTGIVGRLCQLRKLSEFTALQNFFKNSQPIAAQDLFDLLVGKTALNEFAGQISRVRMVR